MADESLAVAERGSKGEEVAGLREDKPTPEIAAPQPPAQPQGPPPGSADLLALGNFLASQGQLRQAAQNRADMLRPKIEAVQTQGTALADKAAATVPTPPTLPAPPSRQLSGFMTARPGETPEASISKFLGALGVFASGAVGLSKGNARGSLAALTGALSGWQQGDAEWAQRRYEDWKAETDTMLSQHKLQREQWEEWFKSSKLSLEQKTKALELDILGSGFDLEPYKIEAAGADGLMKFMEHRREAEERLQLSRDRIVEGRERHLSDQALKRQLADEARETRLAIAAQGAADRIAAREEKKSDKRDVPYKHSVWDKERGDIVTVTQGEREDDLQRALRNEPTRFKDIDNDEKKSIDRLALAPSIIKRLDVLIDRILAENPGENLTQGLINRMKRKMGPDIAVFEELNKDVSVELASALSGGSPRISILNMIQGTAPDLSFTRETAHAQTAAAYTTIANRLTRLTGDPQAVERVSKDFRDYGAAEQRITIVGPNGQRGSVPGNTDMTKYPGWKKE